MRRLLAIAALCLPLAACGETESTCGSDDVLSNLRAKLIEGLNYEIGVKGYYNGSLGKLTLKNPNYIGPSDDMTRCNITMVLTQYADPKTGNRYPTPQEKSMSMPYSFKKIDAMITLVKVNQ